MRYFLLIIFLTLFSSCATYSLNSHNDFSNIPIKKGNYIESVSCDNDNIIKTNGAVYYKLSSINNKKYIDIFNVSLKNGYNQNENCKGISSPVSLSYPKRVRYFLLDDDYNIYINGTNFIISREHQETKKYIISISEEMVGGTQKVKLEFSKDLEIISSKIRSVYAVISIKGRYDKIGNMQYFSDLKGEILGGIEIDPKKSSTKIKIYKNREVQDTNISIDKVDNKLIIYAGK